MRELRTNRWLPRLRRSNRKPRDVAVSALGGLGSPRTKTSDSTIHNKPQAFVNPGRRPNSDRLTLTVTNDSIPQQPSNNPFQRIFKLRDVKKVLRHKRQSVPAHAFRKNHTVPFKAATNHDFSAELRPPPPPPPTKLRFNRRHRSAMPAPDIDLDTPPNVQTVDQFFDDVREEKPKFFVAVEEKERASDEFLDDDDSFYKVPFPARAKRVADVSLTNLPKLHSRPTRPPNSLRFSRRVRAPVIPIDGDQPYVNRFYSEGHRDSENDPSISLSSAGFLDRSRPSSPSRRKMLEPPKTNGREPKSWQMNANELRFNSLNVNYTKRNRDDPMRPITISDASSVQPNLRASLSAPHVSSMKESGGSSFWFAERRKPRSRLLSAFQFRISSRHDSYEDPPPPIADAFEIPWTATGGGLNNDDDHSDSDNPDVSNSFLSFPLFNMLSRGPAVGNMSSSHNSPPRSLGSGSVAKRLLRLPFASRSSPVPAAARAEAKAAEQALEDLVAEKDMRPSDASTIPNTRDIEVEKDIPDDPHEFDVDEYSSLHSAIAAMLSERSAAKSTGEDDMTEMAIGLDSKVRQRRHSIEEEEETQKSATKIRFQSTGAPISEEVANGCAFLGTVLSFNMEPSKTSIQVPPAPLVYGPESTAWRNVLSEFSDPQRSTPALDEDDENGDVDELTNNVSNRPLHSAGSDDAFVPEATSFKRVLSTFERMGSMEVSKSTGMQVEETPPATEPLDTTAHEVEPSSNGIEANRQQYPDEYEEGAVVSRSTITSHYVVPRGTRFSENALDPIDEYHQEEEEDVLAPPTLADVQKLAAETRRKSSRLERDAVLLDIIQPSTLPDVSRESDKRYSAVPSEQTFTTTFSETSREWPDSDRASISSGDLYVDALSSERTGVFLESRNSEVARAPELDCKSEEEERLRL